MDTGPGLPGSSKGDDPSHSTDSWARISARLGVLQILPDMGPSGPARAAAEAAAGVVAAGGRAVVVSAGGRLVADLLRCGATHVEMALGADTKLGRWTTLRRLVKLIQEHRIAIVHARLPGPAWLARQAAREAGVLFTVTCHGLYDEASEADPKHMGVLEDATRVIAVSETVADHLVARHRLPGGRPAVITPGVDLPRFDPARVTAQRIVQLAQSWRLPDGPPVIMSPGRVARSRGHSTLIEALSKLGRPRPDGSNPNGPNRSRREFHCVLAAEAPASPGYAKELAEMAQREGVEGRLVIGEDCRDMPAAYMLADVVVYPRAEGTGFARVVAEAQAMGRPVVAYDSPLLREQTVESRMTWLVPPDNSDALAQAIGEALDLPPAERKALAPEASDIARRRYNRATSAAAMIELFLGLLTQAQAA
jgi:glycosyltransferase involved in cell wall biosynthesis